MRRYTYKAICVLFSLFFFVPFVFAGGGGGGSSPPPEQPDYCLQKSAGCYDKDGLRAAAGGLTPLTFGSYLEANACIAGACECSLPYFEADVTVYEADESQGACGCFATASYVDTIGTNDCCGDDIADCGVIEGLRIHEGGAIIDRYLCAMDGNFVGQWFSAEASDGDIVELGCKNPAVQYVAVNEDWKACNSFEITTVNDHYYLCNDQGDAKEWVECCGSEACNSKTHGKQLTSGQSVAVGQTTYYCLHDGTFSRDLDNSDFDSCEGDGSRNFTWTGSLCCSEEDDPTEYYNDVGGTGGCWDNNYVRAGEIVSDFPNILSLDGQFYGCNIESGSVFIPDAPSTTNSLNPVGTSDADTRQKVTATYNVILDREPDSVGLDFWAATFDNFASERDFFSNFVLGSDPELWTQYQGLLGSGPTTTEQKVTTAYNVILDREPDPEGFAYWVGIYDDFPNERSFFTQAVRSADPELWTQYQDHLASLEEPSNENTEETGADENTNPQGGTTVNLLDLVDYHTKISLIDNKPLCYQDPDFLFLCNSGGEWEPTGGANFSHMAQVPPEINPNPQSPLGCCGPGQCWDGETCVADQSLDANAQPINGLRCIAGEWTTAIIKGNPDEGLEGFCPEASQCLVSPFGNPNENGYPDRNPQCINDGQFIENDYCENGIWASRTKHVAQQLLKLVETTNEYTILCDTSRSVFNNIDFEIEGTMAESLFSEHAYNFCVLEFGGKIVLGTTLKKPLEENPTLVDRMGVDCRLAYDKEGGFHPCDGSGQDDVWYNSDLHSLLYSDAQFTIDGSSSRNFFDIFAEIVRKISGATIDPFDSTFVDNLKKFTKLYIKKEGNKEVKGTVEEVSLRRLVIEYKGFTADICSFTDEYNRRNSDEGSRIACEKQGSTFYVVAEGSEFTKIDPSNIWNDLTSKLRVS